MAAKKRNKASSNGDGLSGLLLCVSVICFVMEYWYPAAFFCVMALVFMHLSSTSQKTVEMTGLEYEYYVAEYLSRHGYHGVRVTKASGDFGVDVIASKRGHKYAVQCKYYKSTLGLSPIQEAVAGMKVYHCDRAMVVTNSTFTSSAIKLARQNNVILLSNIKPLRKKAPQPPKDKKKHGLFVNESSSPVTSPQTTAILPKAPVNSPVPPNTISHPAEQTPVLEHKTEPFPSQPLGPVDSHISSEPIIDSVHLHSAADPSTNDDSSHIYIPGGFRIDIPASPPTKKTSVNQVSSSADTIREDNSKEYKKIDYDRIIMDEAAWRNAQYGLGSVGDQMSKIDRMDSRMFSYWCTKLLKYLGYYNVRFLRGTNRNGIDITADIHNTKHAVICKCSYSDVDAVPVQDVNSRKDVHQCECGIVITNRYFTKQARETADAVGVILLDRDAIKEMLSDQ